MTKTIRLFLCTMILLVATATSAFASYQTYLGGDSNYILVDAHMDTGWYVDKSSLNVQMYNPPQYIIAINVCTVPNAPMPAVATHPSPKSRPCASSTTTTCERCTSTAIPAPATGATLIRTVAGPRPASVCPLAKKPSNLPMGWSSTICTDLAVLGRRLFRALIPHRNKISAKESCRIEDVFPSSIRQLAISRFT